MKAWSQSGPWRKRLGNPDRQELAESIGRLVQQQTRTRINDEKTSPSGAAWKPNRQGSSLLYQSGALAGSIDYAASPDQVQVGSALVYAAIHNFGGKITPKNGNVLAFMLDNRLIQVKSVTIPQREYLGLSSENKEDLIDAAEEWFERLVA